MVLALNDSPSLACLFLACIAVGAIPAVINPKSREQALADIAADCQASLVVREADAPSLSGPLAPLTLRAAAGRPLLDDFSLDALVGPADLDWSAFHRQDPAAACFLQYTSGSTGAPKGVMHSLRNTLGFCRAFATELLALQAGDRLYSIPKMFFGYGMGNSLFFPWFSGASALLDDTWPSPERVLENLVAFRPRVLFGVPAIYASLRPQARELLSSVRLAFSAGSPLPRGEFEFWAAHGLEICDGIGATEVGHVFLANRPGQARADSTGLPLPGYECRLVDREGHTIEEAGRQGVLLVRGPGLSPGYWRASEEQQARFAGGWYRTGDLFERDESGAYRHCGREDDLFKVNGRWVVPTQVEQAICRHLPEVSEAVLVPTCRLHDGLRPTLFVTLATPLDDNQILLAQRIDQHLAEQIPSHMLPSQLHVLPALPRNDNGKLARAELRHLADTLYHDNLPEERARSIQAVGVNLPPSYVCLEGPLGGERPRAQGDEMLMQRLLPAVREALDEAAVKPEEIDLIVGLALSPDHLIENRDIMAPKIGHPLQKVLGANRAHVFDLTDSSLARALYVVDTLASDQGYRNVLVVRGESSQGLEVDSESGFALADGALALLCRPTGKAAFRRGALGGDPAQEWLPLSIPLNTDIRQVGDVKGHLNLPAQPGLPEAVRAGFTRLAGDFPQLNWVREEWFGQGRPDGRCLGPFELASQLRAAQRDRLDELLLISFDPFGMVVEGVTLELAGEAHA